MEKNNKKNKNRSKSSEKKDLEEGQIEIKNLDSNTKFKNENLPENV